MQATKKSVMVEGLVISADKGLYYVESPLGTFPCTARGVFRKHESNIFTGDKVMVEDNKLIVEILPRRNSIIRPPLANLDALVFVVSTRDPSPNFVVLDKFIAISRFKGIEPIIALTKLDLFDYKNICDIYSGTSMRIFNIDYTQENPAKELLEAIKGRLSAFTGNSGVGKSTLLNSIDPNLQIPTAEISSKLGRGKHTTRKTTLYKLGVGGYIADTPGFSTFETERYDIIRKEELAGCFDEFESYIGKCRFQDCSHTAESDCAVISAVAKGDIHKSRHNSYCNMYEQASLIKEWEIKQNFNKPK